MDRLYRGKWDCWADIKLLKTGELDTSSAREALYLDPNHFAVCDSDSNFYHDVTD
jgi:hypothetical protein